MLEGFGYRVHRDTATASVTGGGRLTATAIDVPADIGGVFPGGGQHRAGFGPFATWE